MIYLKSVRCRILSHLLFHWSKQSFVVSIILFMYYYYTHNFLHNHRYHTNHHTYNSYHHTHLSYHTNDHSHHTNHHSHHFIIFIFKASCYHHPYHNHPSSLLSSHIISSLASLTISNQLNSCCITATVTSCHQSTVNSAIIIHNIIIVCF